jgi:trehalose 6-phosphate phosphatase
MKNQKSNIWAFDFDGTISYLVSDRNAAVLDPECKAILADLAGDPEQIVAIVSSRSLEDLKTRIANENIVLAGSSGLEWWVPGGHRLGPNQQAEERLAATRDQIIPALESVQQIPGVDIEDKNWSAAVHFREVASEDRGFVSAELEKLHIKHGVTLHYGPEVAEIQFLQEVSKEIAVKVLASLFGRRLSHPRLIFSGDDQNDAKAMHWVLERKGIVYIVGDRISVEGANIVSNPTALAHALRRRFKTLFE